jgi:hypothetical protein
MMGGTPFLTGEQERADSYYRYSVNCDRTRNNLIAAAARKAGMSATSFVQAHFDAIFDGSPDERGFVAEAFARKHDISAQAARLWRAMRGKADEHGVVSGAAREFAAPAGISQGQATGYLAELIECSLITMVKRPGGRNPGIYRMGDA